MPLSQHEATKHALFFGLAALLTSACHSHDTDVVTDSGAPPPPPFDGGAYVNFCDLPGSVQFTSGGVVQVPGADTAKVAFVHLPNGFCVHYFGNVGNTRQLRFAPGGELFVASPTTNTTGGGQGGHHAILAVPDDNGDGYADKSITFLDNLPSTQGLLFTPGYFYYQDATRILRIPYAAGDRAPSGAGEVMVDVQVYNSTLHWPKALDQADDGTIYVGNGGDQNETCIEPHPFHGGIIKIDGTPGGAPVTQGLRNPIAVRCEHGKNLCFAAELSRDYSAAQGGREKLVPIRQGDDWGFPCCATKDSPYPDIVPVPNCATTAPEDASFLIGDTPFSFDFELGKWAAPYQNSAFVPLHGSAGGWLGARLVMIEMDPVTGLPMPATDIDGGPSGALSDFATGWDDEHQDHGRPAAVTFAPDGRLFLGNDTLGEIFWIAPLDLPRK
jgi:glucose/arabinose dehydrogenase